MGRIRHLLPILCLLLATQLQAISQKVIEKRIATILSQPDLTRGFWGIEVVSLSNGKTLFADEADIEQREFRRPVGDHIERFGHVRGRPHRLHTKPQNRVFEIERNDWIVFDDQHIVGHAVIGGGVHVSRQFKVQHLMRPGAEAPEGTTTSRRP